MAQEQVESITIRVPREIAEDIVFMLEPELGELDREDVLGKFSLLAFQHLYDWLSGRKRYRTITEQHTDWLENIYTRLLPPDEVPGYSRLYNRFNIPYGQAGYIIRVLVERELPHLRTRAREELRSALANVLPDATDAIEEDRPHQPLRVTVSLLADRELCNAADTLYRRDNATLLPQRSHGYGDNRTVMVPAKTVLQILDEL
jgi:hypothetical protein